jgi:hypothetical protein
MKPDRRVAIEQGILETSQRTPDVAAVDQGAEMLRALLQHAIIGVQSLGMATEVAEHVAKTVQRLGVIRLLAQRRLERRRSFFEPAQLLQRPRTVIEKPREATTESDRGVELLQRCVKVPFPEQIGTAIDVRFDPPVGASGHSRPPLAGFSDSDARSRCPALNAAISLATCASTGRQSRSLP